MIDDHVKCMHPEFWAEIRADLKAIAHAQSNMRMTLSAINDRVFVDTSVQSHQTRLSNIEMKLDALKEQIEIVQVEDPEKKGIAKSIATLETKVSAITGVVGLLFAAAVAEVMRIIFGKS